MAEEYLVLQCPACARDVKVKSVFVGRRMGCSYCRAPLEIAEAEPAPDPDASKKPLERQPLVFRLLTKDDLSEDHDLEFADEFERRRLPFESPEWDDETLEGKRRSELEEISESGDEDAAAGGGTRAKSQSRKKLLTRKEQVFRNITILIMTSAFAVVAVIIYSAVVRGLAVAHKDSKGAGVTIPGEGFLPEQETISRYLTSEDEAAAMEVINGFLEAKTVEDRLKFVRHPERVRPLMEAWYQRPDVLTDWPDGTVLLRDKSIDQGRYFIRLAIEFADSGSRFFVVEQTDTDFKLDWETSVGYQPVPLHEFRATRPTTPVAFRVKLKPVDYYNYGFRNRERYYSVELSYPGQSDFKLMGYIDRSHDWARPLIERMEAGEGPSMIVMLRYPEGELEDDRQVEIVAIVSDTWWL